jgi:hypothetical protein
MWQRIGHRQLSRACTNSKQMLCLCLFVLPAHRWCYQWLAADPYCLQRLVYCSACASGCHKLSKQASDDCCQAWLAQSVQRCGVCCSGQFVRRDH